MQATIEEWTGEPDSTILAELAEVLRATVHDGASVSFVLPFALTDALAYWETKVMPAVKNGNRRLLVAWLGGTAIGTVQLDLDTPPNQRHRAEVSKLLVHPSARRRGIGRALMEALEGIARAEGRTLLTLDTRTGDRAEPLYVSMGYILAGRIPRFARGPHGGELEGTSILYKELAA